jgi:acyl-CoA thioester hydrolase
MKAIETSIRVRYAETDMSGIVYNANYLVWFEAARGEFFWQQGKDYARDIEARGYHWPVVEANLRYHAPSFYGDLLTVRAWVGEVKSRAMTIHYEISRDGKKLCTGFTKHMNIDNAGRPVPYPEDIRKMLLPEE